MPPLPVGLRSCPTCGEPRGKTPDGRVATCLCSGVRCNWCGTVYHRPITDYYLAGEGVWVHVPWFGLSYRVCQAPPDLRVGPHWTQLAVDSATREHLAMTTRRALEEAGRAIEESRLTVTGQARLGGRRPSDKSRA